MDMNKTTNDPVRFDELLPAFDVFAKDRELPVMIGVDRAGQNVFADLVDLSHMLIIGGIGSGKSNLMHLLIRSLCHAKTEHEVQLVLMNGKMNELAMDTKDTPQLMYPVITEEQQSHRALIAIQDEMERRRVKWIETGVHTLADYNKQQKNKGQETLPYIVLMMDEMTYMYDAWLYFASLVDTTIPEAENFGVIFIMSALDSSRLRSLNRLKTKVFFGSNYAYRYGEHQRGTHVHASGNLAKRGEGLLELSSKEIIPFQAALVELPE